MQYKYQTKKFVCPKCGITYVVESDNDIKDQDKCPGCKNKKEK